VISHTVLLRFHDASVADEAKTRLEALLGAVPTLRSLSVVVDTLGSPSGHHLALHTTHDDEPGLRAYQQHPAHQEFAAWLKPLEHSRAVVDGEA
jgi:hypothetical protein